MPEMLDPLESFDFGGSRIEVSGSNFRDPAMPPPQPERQFFNKYRSEVPLFLEVFTPNPKGVVSALLGFWPKLAARFAYLLGTSLLRHDSRLAKRWAPLAKSTQEQYKRRGIQQPYPWAGATDDEAKDWISNRWGMQVETEQQGRVTIITAGVGPKGYVDDRLPSNKRLEAESGVAQKTGRGRTTVKQTQRPLGTTEEITKDQEQQIGVWANANAPLLARENTHSPLFTEGAESKMGLFLDL